MKENNKSPQDGNPRACGCLAGWVRVVVVVSRSLGSVRVERSSWLVVLIRFSRFVLCFLCFVSFRFVSKQASKASCHNGMSESERSPNKNKNTILQYNNTKQQHNKEKKRIKGKRSQDVGNSLRCLRNAESRGPSCS